MRNYFLAVIKKYHEAQSSALKGNSLAKMIRHDIKNEILKVIKFNKRYFVKGSSGNGNWAACPWIAIFNTSITKSAQDGYYPVFIFRQDMSGFYLTLNQGVTSIGKEYKKDKKRILKENASYFRSEIGDIPSNFKEETIDLKYSGSKTDSLPENYEAGNIIAKFYDSNHLPDDEVFYADICHMLTIYDSLSLNRGVLNLLEEDKEQKRIETALIPLTEKEQLIKARIGQGVFKTELSKIEAGCRVTGVTNLSFLTASHIKPWCKSNNREKLDGNNGLLLSPHVDRLFDRGFISFADNGDLLIKEDVKNIVETWGLSVKNVGAFNNKQKFYLADHRQRFNFQ